VSVTRYIKAFYTLIFPALLVFLAGWDANAGIVPPRHGGPLPESYLTLRKSEKGAFRLKHGWIARAKRVPEG